MPKPSTIETRERMRREFYDALGNSPCSYDLRSALRIMRRIAGMTQAEYAKFCKVPARSLIDFERGVGNPTHATLVALLKPFNLQLTVGLKSSSLDT